MAYFPWPEYVNTDCSVQLCAAIPSCSSLSSKGSPVLPLEQPIRYVWEFKCSEYSTVEFSAIISHAGTTVSIWFFKAWTSNGWSELKTWDTTFFSGCQGPAAQRTQTPLTFKSENTKHSLSPPDKLRACFKSMYIPQERLGVHGFTYINCWLSNKTDSTDVLLND